MTVKEHYDNHLGNIYSWYTGDFEKNKDAFKAFFTDQVIESLHSSIAIDLGAGNGIQTIAMAELGFNVKAIDFNDQLISGLKSRIGNVAVEVFNDDMRLVGDYAHPQPELIVCCGDTIVHLASAVEIQKVIGDSFHILSPQGKLILNFRDYSAGLEDTHRFIPVRSDSQRILTRFIEFYKDKLKVTDLLHEFENGRWIQKVSSYYETRTCRHDKNSN
jgi:2-polyprenyl-3-methyl-5-hydroxy-6-metoxy-1,4-benzoquinol methylase